ncbi:DUF4105 domain-containing protein [Parabacteroides sp. PF5-6]|uniref:lipoprotein N-acyltransferase Lnb domain-containing protein n=1 Tax=Parabacteroides sp. PF5-6 TaxID=1742403 RepID=UPI002404EFFA|nr:DUF4105 domain-containing protein [Parabacteroides sp. PF5-6]MDF9830321.1 hypothetical protein [Parabacteroides sp. PF5-6]
MKKILVLCLLWTVLFPLKAQWQLSEEAKISILTSAPHDEAVFTVFGHAAFRVYDPAFDYDMVFNYGIFDFSKPNFILRFALGHTDYILGVNRYISYIAEYQMRGSDVTEQVLNLNATDKNALYTALMLNAQPKNRVYRYNFFYDNCATRLPAMIERSIEGELIYHNPPHPKTFRELVHDCTDAHRWLTFGIDLALGSATDRPITPAEMMFLPEYVKQELGEATVYTSEGEEYPLIAETNVIKAIEDDEAPAIWDTVFTPVVCGWLLFLIVIALSFCGLKKGKTFRGIDILLFSIAGIAGCVLFFLCFISEHPAIWPNWSVVWLHPFHLIGVVLFALKKAKKAAYCYHFINFATLLLLLAGWFIIPQQMNAAFIPLIATLAFRSGWHVYCYKKNK